MTDMQSTMVSLRELNTKLAFEISELRKKYAELEAKNIEVETENTKLKQDKKEVEVRFMNLEQKDREKTNLIAKLKHDVSLIKEQNLQNKSNGYTSEQILLLQRESDVNIPNPVINQYISSTDTNSKSDSRSSASHETNSSYFVTASGNDNPEQINLRCNGTSTSDITDDTSNFDPEALITSAELARPRCASLICIENKSSEDIVIDEFLDLKEKERVSNMVRKKNREKKLRSQLDNISQSNKNKVQKFMSEVSTNSSSQLQYTGSISNSSADSDAIPTTLNEIESQSSNTSFTVLYEKLCNAITLANRKTQEAIFCYCNFDKTLIQRHNEITSEKQVDPESNAVSRILNKEVCAQLPTNISDVLLWKRLKSSTNFLVQ
ncbi:3688_t:CDS:2 [Diversispora eburnea]|uniref:3688_t:CDS:1 n=1 Tax=Diversispora eburnea TaxID=1213867 RepID=A0A9N8W6V4_9GLOM|nr:3688_t:CDS:2 [Diversispora eburnea]